MYLVSRGLKNYILPETPIFQKQYSQNSQFIAGYFIYMIENETLATRKCTRGDTHVN